jgi:biopolymer transport protein ExbB/TolQ
MRFALIEVDFDFGPLGKIAMVLILCALITLIYYLVAILVRHSRLRRRAQLLCLPLLTQLETGKWEPAVMSWPDIKAPQFSEIVEALRQELSSRKPLAVIAALNQALDLLTGTLMRMIGRIKVLGWSTGIIGGVGAICTMNWTLRGIAFAGEPATPGPLLGGIYAAILIQICGFIVALACLAVSSVTQNRLHVLYQDLSNRILVAPTKKGA